MARSFCFTACRKVEDLLKRGLYKVRHNGDPNGLKEDYHKALRACKAVIKAGGEGQNCQALDIYRLHDLEITIQRRNWTWSGRDGAVCHY
jgi:hypothetical protein